MSGVEALNKFIDPPIKYVFTQFPDRVPNISAARAEGINCLSLARLALADLFGYWLPGRLCYELFCDTEHFVTVPEAESNCLGDIAWHGPANVEPESFTPQYNSAGHLENWRGGPAQHVSVFTGETEAGDPLLLHASNVEGKTTIWPLSRFAAYPLHAKIQRIGRLAVVAQKTRRDYGAMQV